MRDAFDSFGWANNCGHRLTPFRLFIHSPPACSRSRISYTPPRFPCVFVCAARGCDRRGEHHPHQPRHAARLRASGAQEIPPHFGQPVARRYRRGEEEAWVETRAAGSGRNQRGRSGYEGRPPLSFRARRTLKRSPCFSHRLLLLCDPSVLRGFPGPRFQQSKRGTLYTYFSWVL